MAVRIPKNSLRLAAVAGMAFALQLQTGCTFYVQPADNSQASYQSAPPAPDQPQPDAQQPVADQAPPQPEAYEPPPAPVVTVYEEDLNPYGNWVDVEGYGRCWSPYGRPSDWQPYTVGHWEYSDYGWTWVSEDDEAQWGHVCYHYGRWYRHPSFGWVWIPGVTWAPAWVAWREGGGYCGWAPLPPEAGFGPEVSIVLVDRYVPPERYVYCNERDVKSDRVDRHIVHNNVTIINQTTNITNITYVNNTVINRGVSVTNVQRATGRNVEKVNFTRATTPKEARDLAAAGKPVIFAPPAVQQAENQRAQKARTANKAPRPKPAANQPQVNQPAANQPPANPKNNPDIYKPEKNNPSNPSAGNQPPVNQPAPDQAAEKARREQEQAAAKAKQDQQAAAEAKAKAKQDADAQAQKQQQQQQQADAQAKAKEDQAAAAKAKEQQDAAAKAREKQQQEQQQQQKEQQKQQQQQQPTQQPQQPKQQPKQPKEPKQKPQPPAPAPPNPQS